ncbi:unnamed protein product [Effrenium voratum]|uniref:Uncharacterized protein n=1 Tax=Effrenium voratum TaxID=2562239 RepID=A0AA36J5K6_9DINO|nr:unnamed protein product [Effrenium voratum]
MRAAMLAGFAFNFLTAPMPKGEKDPDKQQHPALEFTYFWCVCVAMGTELGVIVVSSYLSVWAPSLALRGKRGAPDLHKACDTLRDYQSPVFACFMGGWIIYFVASILQVWIYYRHHIAVCVSVPFLVFTLAIIWYLLDLRRKLSLPEDQVVTGKIAHFQRYELIGDIDDGQLVVLRATTSQSNRHVFLAGSIQRGHFNNFAVGYVFPQLDNDQAMKRKASNLSPGKNLNSAYPHFQTAAEMYAHIRSITSEGGDYTVRNFVGVIEDISVEKSMVETELFPRGALEFYTKKNMGWQYTQEEYDKWFMPERGGDQGDYRDGMQEKIANVIACLKAEPRSKRAIIPIPFSSEGSKTVDWTNQGQTKCCRELHLYIEDDKLKCTGILRMQNASIFPKNIHFFSTLLCHVGKELEMPLGEYTHWITNLCHDRSAISC